MRARQRRGERLLTVTVVEDELAAALLAARRLTADEVDDPAALAREASAVLSDWMALWKDGPHR
jgi:hypothetical protein